MHAQSGMDLKTLVEHFPDQSIQTNSVTEPSSPRRGHFISAFSWRSQIGPGIFFYVKTIFSEQYLIFTTMKRLSLHGSMGNAFAFYCDVCYFQTVLGDFCTNISHLLWSQKLLSIPTFHIENKSWFNPTCLLVPRPKLSSPWRGWLRDTNWLNRNVRKVSHKGF